MRPLTGTEPGCPDEFDSPEDAQRHDARKLTGLLDSAGVPVLCIMGNDDLVELNSTSERVRSIHGCRVAFGPFAFVGYQYSRPFMGGVFEKPEDEIQTDLVPLAILLDAQTVFVSHSPAKGILDPGFGRDKNHFNVAAGRTPNDASRLKDDATSSSWVTYFPRTYFRTIKRPVSAT